MKNAANTPAGKIPPKAKQPPAQPPATQITEAQVKVANDVQRARDQLYAGINEYRDLLKQTTLSINRTKMQTDNVSQVIGRINEGNGQLERVNVGEGPLALIITSLHAILGLKDEINDVKFQNNVFLKRLKALEDKGEMAAVVDTEV